MSPLIDAKTEFAAPLSLCPYRGARAGQCAGRNNVVEAERNIVISWTAHARPNPASAPVEYCAVLEDCHFGALPSHYIVPACETLLTTILCSPRSYGGLAGLRIGLTFTSNQSFFVLQGFILEFPRAAFLQMWVTGSSTLNND